MIARHCRNAAALQAAFCFCALSAFAQAPVREASPVPAKAGAVAPAPAATPAPAPAFVTVGDKPAIAYDAPSTKANKTFIFGRFHPLEALVKLEKMTKVRDTENTVGWVENSALGTSRHVQVSAAVADIRATPALTAALVFEAAKGVLLEATGPVAEGWLPVKHRDGQAGFVRASQVWGE
jgi:SH3-like domain-containing protein